MPKISYLDITDNGADYTEVTEEHIEQKIADIEALLRGMIDEDNLLARDNGSGIVPISPSNVVDMPVETRPVQHCMKFFGVTSEHQSGIVETLFNPIVEEVEKNPEFRIIGGVGDNEISVIVEASTFGEVVPETKKSEIEIPFYYTPITCSDLWEIVKNNNKFVGIEADQTKAGTYLLTTKEITTLEEFSYLIGFEPRDIIFEPVFEFPPMLNYIKMGKPSLDAENIINISLTVEPKDVSGYTCRYGAAVLCRVNP